MTDQDEFPDIPFDFVQEENIAFLEKMTDASEFPFIGIECDPEEAERAGAFSEDAISEADVIASMLEIAS